MRPLALAALLLAGAAWYVIHQPAAVREAATPVAQETDNRWPRCDRSSGELYCSWTPEGGIKMTFMDGATTTFLRDGSIKTDDRTTVRMLRITPSYSEVEVARGGLRVKVLAHLGRKKVEEIARWYLDEALAHGNEPPTLGEAYEVWGQATGAIDSVNLYFTAK